MNKSYKVILIVIVILVGLILLDTLQARLLKHSPFISWKENLESKNSYVDRGILMDTYYCVKENDMVEVSWHLKTTNFTCFETSTNESDGGRYKGNSYSIDNVSMQIKEGTLTNKSLTLVIKDSTNDKYSFEQEFYLEKKTNNVWSKLKKVHTDYAFNQMAYYADNKELELKQDWDYIYGTLEKGTYRLVKKVFKNSDIPVNEEKIKLISVDFEIK